MSNALIRQDATISPAEWPVIREQATMLIKTGFLPSAVNTAEKAIAIMMKGRELGIPPMYALSNIAVIQGKPTCGAELMLALIYRDHGDDAIQFTESTDRICTISFKRRSATVRTEQSFTIEQAKQARLAGDNWQKYPAAMLRARCISAVARMAFPDSIGGMHTPEEMGAEVTEEGEVLSLPAPAPSAPRTADPAQFLPEVLQSDTERAKALRTEVKSLAAKVFTDPKTATKDLLLFLQPFNVSAIKNLSEEEAAEAKRQLEECLEGPEDDAEDADFTPDPEEEEDPFEEPRTEGMSDEEIARALYPDDELPPTATDPAQGFKGGRQ